MPSISRRAVITPASPIRKLVPFADAATKQGVKIYHLNIGQPDIKSPPKFLKAIRSYPKSVVAYENSLGNPKLRLGLASYYHGVGIPADPENIIVTTGGSEAILFAILATCDPGDELLVFEPTYANYLGFAAMAAVSLRAITTRAETGFHLPRPDVIKRHITSNTKAIIINNPNNPTGTLYTPSELAMVNNLAIKHELFVISDETYREFAYERTLPKSLLTYGKTPRHVILVDSFSKRYSLCGARLGCLVTYNQKILESVTKFAQARLASPSVEQYAAVEALKTQTSYFAKVNREYKKRRNVLIRALQKIPGVFVQKPEGAFYCVARLPVKNAEAFAKWLLTDFRDRGETVMLAPADGFYLSKNHGKDEVRIAYVLNSRALARSVEIIKKALAIYRKKNTTKHS